MYRKTEGALSVENGVNAATLLLADIVDSESPSALASDAAKQICLAEPQGRAEGLTLSARSASRIAASKSFPERERVSDEVGSMPNALPIPP